LIDTQLKSNLWINVIKRQTANWQKKQEKISREHYDKVYVLLEDLRKDIMVRNVSFNPSAASWNGEFEKHDQSGHV
jgi:hypothetical protein